MDVHFNLDVDFDADFDFDFVLECLSGLFPVTAREI